MAQKWPIMAQNDPKWPKMAQKWPKITPNGPKMTPEFKHFFRIRQICQQSRRPTNWFRNKVVEGGFFRKLSEISFSFKHQSFVRVEWVSVLADCSHTHRGQTTKTTNKLGRNERTSFFLRKVKVKIENTGGWLPTNLWSNGKDFLKQETEKRKGRRGQLGAAGGNPWTHQQTWWQGKKRCFFSNRNFENWK